MENNNLFNLENNINNIIKTDWDKHLLSKKELLIPVSKYLEEDKEKFDGIVEIFPPPELIFNAFNHFDFNKTKVVIIGQDVYIRKGEAMGLSFSVPDGIKMPPSLRNIFKELKNDLGIVSKSTDLTRWAKQGVLLLNSALTVREGKSGSHIKQWEKYTDYLIKYISDNSNNKLIFILWGKYAKNKKEFIDKRHYILEGGHPSPLNRLGDFAGGKYFSKTNNILKEMGEKEINW